MKPKIIIDREPVSSEEIQSRKDFRKVVSQVALMQKPFFKSTWFISSAVITGTMAAIAVVAIFAAHPPTEDQQEEALISEVKSDSIPANALMSSGYYSEDSPCIKPPVPGAELQASTYTVDNQKGAVLKHSTGTEIRIPANSLTDESGNVIQGKAELQYREYHTVPEIILSGIPMTYDSAGTRYAFETAGMFDIHCVQNGKKVYLDEKKPISVKMQSTSAEGRFNFYELDTAARNWVYLGKGKNEAIVNENKVEIDEVEIEKNSEVVNTNKHSVQSHPEVIKKTGMVEQAKKEVVKTEESKPVEPRKLNPDKYNFLLNVDPEEFPEMASFKSTRFEVGEESKNFDRTWFSKTWNDVRLREKSKGISYYLDLTLIQNGKPNTSTVVVYPAFDGKDYEMARKRFDQQFTTYEKTLSDKKAELAKKEAELKAEIKKQEIEFARQEMARKEAEKERERIRKQQIANANRISTNSFGQMVVISTGNQVRMMAARTFSVAKFGTFNCDSPHKFPSERVLSATFSGKTDGEEHPIVANETFLVNRKTKMYYPYSSSMLNQFGYNPKGDNMILIILADGKTAVFAAEDFQKIPNEVPMYHFTMRISDSPVRDASELEKLIFG